MSSILNESMYFISTSYKPYQKRFKTLKTLKSKKNPKLKKFFFKNPGFFRALNWANLFPFHFMSELGITVSPISHHSPPLPNPRWYILITCLSRLQLSLSTVVRGK